ncbi:MAG: hypothetical protein HYY51_02280 [Candidatus Magasanikbacteria bacterium]|nr:hypothetical protein [Candidatus Magasanikbacteria bacterium]
MDETHDFVVLSLDINTRGLAVRICVHVPELVEMDLNLSLRPPETLTLRGRVVKIDPPEPAPGQGIYQVMLVLEDPGPEEMRHLSGYLLSQLSWDRKRMHKHRIQ